ncbi:MAG: helix-turn-helix domain-containing protein [Prevotella sp.]|nr:helix-turn-helix domain-containing protein [Prevotella sp.]
MQIKTILDSGTAVNITVSLRDLNEFVSDLLREREAEVAMLRVENGDGERYLSLKETARMMNVSKTTIWRYGNEGILKPVKVGGTIRYRLSDINKLMERRNRL